MEGAARVEAEGPQHRAAREGARGLRGEPTNLWQSSRPRRAAGRRRDREREDRREDHARRLPRGAGQEALPRDDRLEAQRPDRAERRRSQLRHRREERHLGYRRDVYLDAQRLAVPRRNARPVLAPRRRLGDERDERPLPGARRAPRRDHDEAATSGPRAALRSRKPLRQRRRPRRARALRHDREHEPEGRLLGQRRRRELLQHLEDRARWREHLHVARRDVVTRISSM